MTVGGWEEGGAELEEEAEGEGEGRRTKEGGGGGGFPCTAEVATKGKEEQEAVEKYGGGGLKRAGARGGA